MIIDRTLTDGFGVVGLPLPWCSHGIGMMSTTNILKFEERTQFQRWFTSNRRHICLRRQDWASSPYSDDFQCHRRYACSIHPVLSTWTKRNRDDHCFSPVSAYLSPSAQFHSRVTSDQFITLLLQGFAYQWCDHFFRWTFVWLKYRWTVRCVQYGFISHLLLWERRTPCIPPCLPNPWDQPHHLCIHPHLHHHFQFLILLLRSLSPCSSTDANTRGDQHTAKTLLTLVEWLPLLVLLGVDWQHVVALSFSQSQPLDFFFCKADTNWGNHLEKCPSIPGGKQTRDLSSYHRSSLVGTLPP